MLPSLLRLHFAALLPPPATRAMVALGAACKRARLVALAGIALACAALPFIAAAAELVSSTPADGAHDVSPGAMIELRFRGLPAVPERSLAATLVATLIGPRGAVPTTLAATGSQALQLRPGEPLLPDSTYTLVIKPAAEGTRPLAIVGFKTRALPAAAAPLAADIDDGPADERFTPGPAQRRGLWASGARHLHSRDARAQALEQQALFDRLPATASRERLRASMVRTGEFVALETTRAPPARATAAALATARPLNATATTVPTITPTSLGGQVLRLNGQPLAGVRLSIGSTTTATTATTTITTTTGPDGEFNLEGASPGTQVLVIDGHQAGQAGQPGADFGRYEYRVELQPGANELPHTIWLTRIDKRHAVQLASPTVQETIVTHPGIPGLELRIPAGTVIRDADGGLVTEVSITPIPIDQTPFPMPYADVPVYYTIQPGGARIESITGAAAGATLHYPNYSTQPPGAVVDLFDYDPRGRGWYVYGRGLVSADGQRVDSTTPFTIYQFELSAFSGGSGPPVSGGPPPPPGPPCPGCYPRPKIPKPAPPCDASGDPVTCASGQFMELNTDLEIADIAPIVLRREYGSGGTNQSAFGVGSNSLHNMYLFFEPYAGSTATAVNLVLPSGTAVRFLPVSANTNLASTGAIFQSSEPGEFFKASFGNIQGGYGNDFAIRTTSGDRYGFSYRLSRLKWLEDRYGNRTTILRDTSNRVTYIIAPGGRWITFAYTATSCTECITRATDPTGRSVQYDYDTLGRLARVTRPEGDITNYTYDSFHRMLTVTNARGLRKVLNEYYAATGNAALDGRVKKQTYADNTTHDFAYFFFASAPSVIDASEVKDARGFVRRRIYNADRQIVSDNSAFGTPEQLSSNYERQPITNLVTLVTDPLNRRTRYGYDTLGNLLFHTVLDGTPQLAIWQTSYEPAFNQPLVSTDPLLRKLTRTYVAGRLAESVDDLGHKTLFEWYPNGRLRAVTRQPQPGVSLTTRFEYNAFGDLVLATDALGRSTAFEVDALGRTVAVIDPARRRSSFSYDGLDRLVQRCNSLAQCAGYTFDANSNLLSFAIGATRRDWTYDAMDRVLTEGQGAAVELSWEYALGLLKKTTDASGRVAEHTAFDALGRVKQTQVSQGGVLKRTIDYGYDNAGRVLSVADSVAGSLAYSYDNRFDAVAGETSASGSMAYTYLANGLRQSALPSGGTALSYAYDPANRLTGITQAAGSGAANPAIAQQVGFTYDDAGRRTRLALANGVSLDYAWDDADQLGAITYRLGAATLGGLAYGHDAAGQRVQMSGSFARANLPAAVSLPVGADGRTVSDNGSALSYDAMGRLTLDPQYRYVWNDLGQLAELRNRTGDALRASFSYDAAGRRSQKTVDGVTTRYLHDGANPVQLQDAAGAPQENLLAGGVDEWFARTRSGQTQHFLTDALGSTLRLTDAAGAKLVDYTYDAYGGSANDNAAVVNPLQYTGRENDGLGLYFYRARYLKTRWGRFVSPDPIGVAGGDSRFAYVEGNPVSFVDPTGLMGQGSGAGSTGSRCSGGGPGFDFDNFVKQIEENRFDLAATLGTLVAAEAVGTMPKTPGELRGLGVPKGQLNPYTSQLSRWSGRMETRALRELGRTAAGVAIGTAATAGLIFEGFYDWGVIGKAAWDSTSSSSCGCK